MSVDYRIIILVLVVIIAGMLIAWMPWNKSGGERTVKVTGETQLKAEPDEFVFYPSYEFKNADKTAALGELAAKSEEITTKLKSLGVDSSKIKTNSSGYDYPIYTEPNSKTATYSVMFTITVGNRELTQKVQDYLVSTNPSGQVSPQGSFSDQKRKSLESQARDQATKEARTRADQMAKNLGFKVGGVKSIEDNGGFGDQLPIALGSNVAEDSAKRLAVQPGENELHYSVTVVYFVK